MIPPATHVYTDEPVEPEPTLIDCPRCHGDGEVGFNLSRYRDPQCDNYAPCPDCHGEGAVFEIEARDVRASGPHDPQGETL